MKKKPDYHKLLKGWAQRRQNILAYLARGNTYQQAGDKFGISRQRVEQIVRAAEVIRSK